MTRFWLIRHALVEPESRLILYGTMDVALCTATIAEQAPHYATLARNLPPRAQWVISGLARTRQTAESIFAAGYPAAPLHVEPDLVEQHLGDWQGLVHAALPARLTLPPHAFWPLGGQERPPGGESMADVILRVGRAMDRLAAAYDGRDVVIVSHGGAIRAAVAHAIGIGADNALHLAVQNLSVTRLERQDDAWRVVCVNCAAP